MTALITTITKRRTGRTPLVTPPEAGSYESRQLSSVPAPRSGLVIIPPGLAHAFGAAEGEVADVVVVLNPGIEGFGYFKQLAAISRGEAELDSLLPDQDRYDVRFEDIPDWRSAP
ncbi:hypothetical protein [Streptomyces sp. NPDC048643]|uniref:hypothetical protein n=1 Tax=Streptomyces sp. NPDC048643 TaxID=3155637 RepID=UPI0034124841